MMNNSGSEDIKEDRKLEEKKTLEKEEIFEWLRTVQDPELFLSVVDLGLVYEAILDESGKLDIRMTLTSPGCPAGDYIMQAMKDRAKEHPAIQEVDVHIVWEPRWDPSTMASDEVKDRLGIW